MGSKSSVFGGIALVIGIGFFLGARGAAADPPAVGISSDVFTAASTLYEFECVQASCPTNLLLVNPDGTHYGCFQIAFANCSGSCYDCQGYDDSTYFCRAAAGKACKVPDVHRIVICGFEVQHVDGCGTANPGGWPTTSNGCYCDNSVGSVTTNTPCNVGECQ